MGLDVEGLYSESTQTTEVVTENSVQPFIEVVFTHR